MKNTTSEVEIAKLVEQYESTLKGFYGDKEESNSLSSQLVKEIDDKAQQTLSEQGYQNYRERRDSFRRTFFLDWLK